MDSGSRTVEFKLLNCPRSESYSIMRSNRDARIWVFMIIQTEHCLNPQNYHNLISFVPNHRIDLDEGHYWTTIILPRWITTSIDFPFFRSTPEEFQAETFYGEMVPSREKCWCHHWESNPLFSACELEAIAMSYECGMKRYPS